MTTLDPLWAVRVLLRRAQETVVSRVAIAEAFALHGLEGEPEPASERRRRLILTAIEDKCMRQSQAYLLDIYSAVSGQYEEPLRNNVHHRADNYLATRPLDFQADLRDLERAGLIVRFGSGWRAKPQ